MPGPKRAEALLVGVAAGGFSGLTGVGGGAIMVPLMTGRLGLGQHRAHGTSLAIIVFVAAAGAAGYARAGNVDWPLVLALLPGALAGVYVGARAMVKVPALQLRFLFGIFLLLVAFRQLAWDYSAGGARHGLDGLAIDVAVGFAGGALAGVLGVGGGAIFVPAIAVFGLTDAAEPQKVAQGVSLVVIVATGALGTFVNLRQSVVDAWAFRWIAAAAMSAGLLAALVANDLNDDVLTVIYGLIALALGAETLWSSVRALRAPPVVERA